MLITGKFEYLDVGEDGKSVIDKAREQLQAANTEVREQEEAVKKAQGLKDELIADARREADKIVSAATREADSLTAEAQAIADDLEASIAQIGVQPTVDLMIAGQLTGLIRAGVMPTATVTQDSIFGKVFYGSQDGTQPTAGQVPFVATPPSGVGTN